jgi:hypothetical protein
MDWDETYEEIQIGNTSSHVDREIKVFVLFEKYGHQGWIFWKRGKKANMDVGC